MRPPEELDSVDWASLRHGMRADASNVPRIIRALYADDGRSARERVRSLWVLNCWAEVYSATLAAIPFLAHAAAHVPAVRAELIRWLADIADGRGPGSTERGDADAAVFDLVLAELPALLRFLEDPDPETRRAVVCLTPLASLVGEDVGKDVGDRLARRYEEDPDGMVRADALSALAALRRDVVRRWAAGAVTDPEPLVRERAAVLLLEEAGTPYPADLVEVLAEASAHAPPRDGLLSLLVVAGPSWLDEDRTRAYEGLRFTRVRALALRTFLRAWCGANHINHLDLWEPLRERSDLLVDGLHPTAEGHRALYEHLDALGR